MLILDMFGLERMDKMHPMGLLKDMRQASWEGLPDNVILGMGNVGIGIEIEMENANFDYIHGPLKWWYTDDDPSLRNRGVELITRFGLRTYQAWEALQTLADCITRAQAKSPAPIFTQGERTSVHVHIDLRYLSMPQVQNFCMLYTLFEDSFFQYVSPDRKHNIYCTPLRFWSNLFKFNDMIEAVECWEKYSAFNLTPIKSFGTAEFRHMEGTMNPGYIWRWILMISLLRFAAKKFPTNALRTIISKLKRESHYDSFINQVFYSLAPHIRYQAHEFDDSVSDAKAFFFEENS